MITPEFNKGTEVCIMNSGFIFSRYQDMAKKLGAKNWKAQRRIKDGVIVTVINSCIEDQDGRIGWKRVMYLVKDKNGYEYVAGENGLERIIKTGWFSKKIRETK